MQADPGEPQMISVPEQGGREASILKLRQELVIA